jgi:hypothetical protein
MLPRLIRSKILFELTGHIIQSSTIGHVIKMGLVDPVTAYLIGLDNNSVVALPYLNTENYNWYLTFNMANILDDSINKNAYKGETYIN